MKYVKLKAVLITAFILFLSMNLVFDYSKAEDTWWDTSFHNFRCVTVESDFISEHLVNFPLLVVLDNSSGDFN